MTLDEQLAWFPRLERIQQELDRIFGPGTELTVLWQEWETWDDARNRVIDRRVATAARRGYDGPRREPERPMARPGRVDAGLPRQQSLL